MDCRKYSLGFPYFYLPIYLSQFLNFFSCLFLCYTLWYSSFYLCYSTAATVMFPRNPWREMNRGLHFPSTISKLLYLPTHYKSIHKALPFTLYLTLFHFPHVRTPALLSEKYIFELGNFFFSSSFFPFSTFAVAHLVHLFTHIWHIFICTILYITCIFQHGLTLLKK